MNIQDIKSALKIETVLNHYHLKVDKNNRLCCPWHKDKTPSLQIYPKTNTWTCFSSNCDAGSGDTIEMIQKMEKCTKHEALKKAVELCGETSSTKSEESLAERFNIMRGQLLRSKKALNYLKGRNIDPIKMIIGFNSYQSGYKQLQNCITFPLKDRNGNILQIDLKITFIIG